MKLFKHKQINRQNRLEKMYQVLKWLKQFQYSAIQQAVSINKSKHCVFLRPKKSCGYLLNVEPNNLAILKTFTTQFDYIILTSMD